MSIPIPPNRAGAARAFYGELLQLSEMAVPRELSALDEIWYQLGDTELHLFTEEVQADRSARHFCIAVDDVGALRRRMTSAGVPVVGATPLPGRLRHFCRDPFGNLIEFATIQDDDVETASGTT